MANSRGRKLYRVTLSAQERRDLKAIGHRGCLAPGTNPDAEGALVDADIALGIGTATFERLRKRCVLEGRRPQPQGAGEPPAKTGAMEAKLVSSPPEGCGR